MGKVRWAGWTMAIVTALTVSGAAARADIASDKPAAIVIYPKIAVDTTKGVDTVVRLSNTNQAQPILAHCFYLDANSHCSGGDNEGAICTSGASVCTSGGQCIPGWQEIDFRIRLTAAQPIEWKASDGLKQGRTCNGGSNDGKPCKVADDCPGGGSCPLGIPLTSGVCQLNPSKPCGVDQDCSPFPGGTCTTSNGGTLIPGVPEDPFVGELKCIAIDENGVPIARNDLKGEGLLETSTETNLDVASYNAIGVQATGNQIDPPNVLTLGGQQCDSGDNAGLPCTSKQDCPNGTCVQMGEYNGCPNFLILNHFFEDADDPVPGSESTVQTNLVLVPCSEDLLRQIPGAAVVQYLVFNEFEQRFSTSKSVTCFQDTRLCKLDTPDCSRSIFNVNTSGTLTGQTRINPIGKAPLPSGLLGIAVETHTNSNVRSAAFNLHMQGARSATDTITIP
ncbi:MAG TPA: hypothetical protein VMW56_24035 [Candidatus Margulisiibacteriota bacterium]|nr:hypothetical protein [Candidatus Margulisiibacteriota bacterium]